MEITTQSPMKYEKPPINEIVCGIHFDSIKKLRSVHLGILWQKFKSDFPKIEDHNLIVRVPTENLENPDKLLLPRVWFIHRDENALIQVQHNRFLHNWRKRQADDEYPGYTKVIEDFETYLARFEEFLAEENLGKLVSKEYELTYIDLIPRGQGWENDLAKFFPNLLSPTRHNVLLNDVKDINWQTVYSLPKGLGQLIISIRSAHRRSDNQQLFHIEFTALSNGPYQPIRTWFNVAHDTITEFFSNLVNNEIYEKLWGRKPC